MRWRKLLLRVALFENLHKFVAGKGFLFQQIGGQLVHHVAIVAQDLQRLLVGGTDDFADFLVHLGGGVRAADQ